MAGICPNPRCRLIERQESNTLNNFSLMSSIKKFLYVSLFLLAACGPEAEDPEEETERLPNVVIVLTDDQGYEDLGVFGSPDILTPNIDRMAAEGAQLTRYYVAQPVCSASRVSLLTGCYPNRVGISGALGPGSKVALNHDEVTIAEMLKPLGYASACFGKWHLGDTPEYLPPGQGFDEFYGIPYSNDMWPNHPWQGTVFNFPPLPLFEGTERIDTLEDQSMLTTNITERAVDFVDRHADQPFFLYVPHPQPHVPLFVSDKFRGKSERGLYGDVIMEIDWSVGQILDALERNGLTDNTIVLFTSDNGPWLSYGTHSGSAGPLREGKGTSWEGGVRVPFVAKWPGHIRPGTVTGKPVMSIDILPTLAAITGAELPENKIDGMDVWPILSGEPDATNPHDAYFVYYHRNDLQAVITDEWKLMLPQSYRTLNGREGRDDGIPIDYEMNQIEEPELYRLADDIGESENLADQHPEVVERLLGLADEMREELGDDKTDTEGSANRPAAQVVPSS